MKIFYFGSVCDNTVFNETVNKSRVKPSASAQNFEYALINGFSENSEIKITAVSAESIAIFPNGNRLILKKRRDRLTENITTDIVPAVNLPLLKQYFHAHGTVKRFKKWQKHNAESDKCVLTYGIYPSVAKKMIKACKKYDCKIFSIITDVPETMFTYTKSKSFLKSVFGGAYRKTAVELQNKFDGYIYLTEAMSEKIAPDKPYTVVEAIVDSKIFDSIKEIRKSELPVIMYAGALYKKYGVDIIVSAFEKVKTECELWLFGSGDYEDEIKKKSKNNPKIKFFGRVPHEVILEKEKEASLLLNIRSNSEEYTRYSFPSKMIEYMLSGTPLLTTRLEGIPNEYYGYVYSLNTQNSDEISAYIDQLLSDTEGLGKKGAAARNFVLENKNEKCQTNKILKFLAENCLNESSIH